MSSIVIREEFSIHDILSVEFKHLRLYNYHHLTVLGGSENDIIPNVALFSVMLSNLL
jgi:hypothetical protein